MKAKQMEGQWVAESTCRELHNQLQDMVGRPRRVPRAPDQGRRHRDHDQGGRRRRPAGGDQLHAPATSRPRRSTSPTYGPKPTQEQVFKDSAELMTSVFDGYNVASSRTASRDPARRTRWTARRRCPGWRHAMERLFEVITSATRRRRCRRRAPGTPRHPPPRPLPRAAPPHSPSARALPLTARGVHLDARDLQRADPRPPRRRQEAKRDEPLVQKDEVIGMMPGAHLDRDHR